jgi:hypothetical protein
MLLREHRFKFFARNEEYVFRVDELVAGIAAWPNRFRLRLPASARAVAKTFYGPSCEEVAEKAADFVASYSGHLEKNTAAESSQGPPAPPRRQAPRPLQLQVSENE